MKIRCDKKPKGCSECIARQVECTVSSQTRTTRSQRNLRAISPADGLLGNTTVTIANNEDQRGSERVVILSNKDKDSFYCLGVSSGYSLFTAEGIQWIRQKTGQNNLDQILADETFRSKTTWGSFDPSLWRSLPKEEHEPLPAPELAMSYVDCYFERFNSTFPLFGRSEFDKRLQVAMFKDAWDDTAWYAALNIVMAIGSALEHVSRQNGVGLMLDPDDPALSRPWRYFKNACSMFSDIAFQDTGIVGVCALVGMVCQSSLLVLTSPTDLEAGLYVDINGKRSAYVHRHRNCWETCIQHGPSSAT